jgi:Mrp family chromosome partitioning ATPase
MLSVVPGTDPTPDINPEVIANGVFSKAIKRWQQAYDVILLDSPPVLAAADAQILAQHVAGVVFVASPGKSHRSDVIEALASLQAAGSQIWGTVFVNGPSSRNLAGSYSYMYDTEARSEK